MLPEYFEAVNLNGAMSDEELSMMVMRFGKRFTHSILAKLQQQ